MAERRPNLPYGLQARHPKPGDLYSPDEGEHKGHIVEFLTDDGIRHNCLGHPLRSHVVRCRDCLMSWAFAGPETDC